MTEPWPRCDALPETTRLFFRRWRADDTELAMGLWGDPRVTELIDARSPLSTEQVHELLVMELAFERLRVAALFAGHNPRNTASQHLLTKLGFRYTHDEHYAPTGLMHPSYLLEAGDYAGA